MKIQQADVEADLIRSGFTANELRYLHKNISRFGGSLPAAVFELANRFRMVISVTAGAVVLFLAVAIFREANQIISAGIALLLMLLVVWFFQPPVIAYKAWRYRRAAGKRDR